MRNLAGRVERMERDLGGGTHLLVVRSTENKAQRIADYLAVHPGMTEDELLVVVIEEFAR